ncbi:TPM domain-containing protein [Hymenobacter sp. 15J16-1T3B]|uniref:TPM domain-containing protein n=1 Tax=Hymenobacter sp. 15J16-1T3B TaxID=2886941 RepID=UPI001D10437B|nr:TPM domain-containing protein [Hymenobacter sp. 15J16-1T3B]MCC3156224.1 TPM domain-containing protein [Hymenobacter sp. 15J16-1T3B]
MYRFLLLVFLCLVAAWGQPAYAAPAGELPPRPAPFQFVTDQANLLPPADAQKLEQGLRRYADNTGTQIVVVTVPTLDGRPVADYARALGTAWGVGQRDQDNGVVVLLAGQEHKVSIQAGSGLRQQLPPELINRIIGEQMTPSFKQGNYFLGLRTGLNTLMLAANPDSDPRKKTSAAAGATAGSAAAGSDLSTAAAPTTPALDEPTAAPAEAPFSPNEPTAAAAPAPGPGFGLGAMALGALVLGGGVWLLLRLFRRRAAANTGYGPGQPAGPGGYNQAGGYGRGPVNQPAPDFYPNRGGSGFGGGSGPGLGGALLTGAAAAAGAYIGNRMASGHDADRYDNLGTDAHAAPPLPTGSGASSGGFPLLDNTGNDQGGTDAPDYFADDAADSSPDYFSSGDSGSYDDPSSGDTGGGGFDDTNDNSGSW